MNRNKIISEFVDNIDDNYVESNQKWKHPLVKSTIISKKDKVEAIDSILSTYITMGTKVKNFETKFSKYINVKYGIMLNSGSSANLLIMFLLKYLNSNDIYFDNSKTEIIIPAFTWSTSLFPIVQAGFKPVFVDVDINNFNLDSELVKKAITKNTCAIMVVHLLGYPCDMTEITKIAKSNNLIIIEDCCEAHGALWDNKKVGSFGDFSSFSFFFSHHITTGEGGLIATNNDYYSDFLRSLRAHGWVREMSQYDQLSKKYPSIDKRFLFYNPGFNLRPTDIVAALGLNQIDKLDEIVKCRRANHFYWKNGLSEFEELISTIDDPERGHISPFVFPIIIKDSKKLNRNKFQKYLENQGIETRTVASGNLLNQPFAQRFTKFEKRFDLNNSDYLMYNSFFWGNSHTVSESERNYVLDCTKNYLNKVINKS